MHQLKNIFIKIVLIVKRLLQKSHSILQKMEYFCLSTMWTLKLEDFAGLDRYLVSGADVLPRASVVGVPAGQGIPVGGLQSCVSKLFIKSFILSST